MQKLTDYSYFETKVDLRLNNLPAQKKFYVLDCFAGNGLIWKRIQELRPYERTHILLSFPPELFGKIEALIEQVRRIDGVEYEQGSN